ncbi:MAG: glycosyltransferase family 39 protein [Microgenomates group bacterium]
MRIDKWLLFVIALCILNFFLRIPFMHTLPYNDQAVYYDATLKMLNNNLNPFTLYISYRPPVFIFLSALLFKFFGPSLTVGSLIIYTFSSLSLLFTYLLGKQLFDKKTGLYATVLLCIFPLFMSQSFFFNDVSILTFLLLMTMYAYFTHNKLWYYISATLLVLTKEPFLFIPFFICLYEAYRLKLLLHFSLSKSIRQAIPYCLPLIAILIWMGLNKMIFSFYLDPANFGLLSFNRNFVITIQNILQFIFLFNGIWLIWPTIITYVVIFLAKKIPFQKKRYMPLLFFLFLFFFYVLLYFFSAFVPRYLLPLYPYLFIVSGATMMFFFSKIKALILSICIGTIFICIHIAHYYYLPMDYWGETDLNLFHVTTLYTKSIEYIHTNYPNALIVTLPWLYQWDTPSFKYSNPLYKENMHFWNINNEGTIELGNVFYYANKQNLSPIIFIDPSYIDEPNDPPILDLHKEKIIILYDSMINRYNYHTLYRITKDSISSNE